MTDPLHDPRGDRPRDREVSGRRPTKGTWRSQNLATYEGTPLAGQSPRGRGLRLARGRDGIVHGLAAKGPLAGAAHYRLTPETTAERDATTPRIGRQRAIPAFNQVNFEVLLKSHGYMDALSITAGLI